VIVAIVMLIVMLIVVAMLVTMIAAIVRAMFVAVVRNVHFVVPVIFNKIDLTAAGVILSAVPAPVARMVGGHVQIKWLYDWAWRASIDDDRPGVNDWRRPGVAEIDLTVEAGLSKADCDADISSQCRSENRSDGHCK